MMDSPPTWHALLEAGDGAFRRGALQEAEAYYELALAAAEAARDIPAQRLLLARLNLVSDGAEGRDARTGDAISFVVGYPALLKKRMKEAAQRAWSHFPRRTKRE